MNPQFFQSEELNLNCPNVVSISNKPGDDPLRILLLQSKLKIGCWKTIALGKKIALFQHLARAG